MKETYRAEWVKCGKGCGGCPHGPYWYAYWKEKGKLHKRYCGKGDPRGSKKEAPGSEQKPKAAPHPHDAIFSGRTSSIGLAFQILGIPITRDMNAVKSRYRRLSLELHPDRQVGQDDMPFKRVAAAFGYIRKVYG